MGKGRKRKKKSKNESSVIDNVMQTSRTSSKKKSKRKLSSVDGLVYDNDPELFHMQGNNNSSVIEITLTDDENGYEENEQSSKVVTSVEIIDLADDQSEKGEDDRLNSDRSFKLETDSKEMKISNHAECEKNKKKKQGKNSNIHAQKRSPSTTVRSTPKKKAKIDVSSDDVTDHCVSETIHQQSTNNRKRKISEKRDQEKTDGLKSATFKKGLTEAAEIVDASDGESKTKSSPATSDKNKTNSKETGFHRYPYFFISGKEKGLVLLKGGEEFGIRGKVNIQVLAGSVNIMGYELQPKHGKQPIFSPLGYSYTTVKSKGDTKFKPAKVKAAVKDYLKTEESELVEMIMARLNVCYTIIVLSECQSLPCDYVTNFNKYQNMFCNTTNDTCEGLNCGFIEDISSEEGRFKRLEIYDEATDFVNTTTKNGRSPKIVLCGGKNVGKSSFARYLLNSCLNSHPKIAFLECDPGQTEFTPSGNISLHIISEPVLDALMIWMSHASELSGEYWNNHKSVLSCHVLPSGYKEGPPFTHIRQPESQCFVGLLSPADDPDHYINCIRHVWNHWTSFNGQIPLVINTMGWNKGLGLHLLVETLRLVEPDVVVQLNSHQTYRNMPPVSTEYVQESPGWTDMPVPDGYKHELIICDSPVNQLHQRSTELYGAPDFRAMTLLSYFSALFDSTDPASLTFNLCALTPYAIPWKDVALHVCNSVVPNSHIMYALNASVVALCHVNKDMICSFERHEEELPKFLKHTPVCECFGFGIIRAIDPVDKLFYILSPEGTTRLQKVNCLLKGALEVPVDVLLQQKDSEIPYIDSQKSTPGTAAPRKRHLLRSRSKSGPQGQRDDV